MRLNTLIGSCDACDRTSRVLKRGFACGVEGAFCAACTGRDPCFDMDDLEADIKRLRERAQTGEQWVHVRLLEHLLVELEEGVEP